MSINIAALFNQKVLNLSANGNLINDICLCSNKIESNSEIYEISITKDFVIITKKYIVKSQTDGTDKIVSNNIDAYDWKGNHLWNIADIVGNINIPFWGGTVTTKKIMRNHIGFDEEKYEDDCDLYCCSARNHLYVIDLSKRRLVQTIETR